jgi:multidrug resistance efflux pump
VVKYLLYLLPLAAASLLSFAVYHVYHSPAWKPLAAPPSPPVQATLPSALAAVGVVEAGSQNVAVAAPQPGVVAAVMVNPGQVVSKGEVLFRLDGRSLEAELQLRLARLATAQAQLARLAKLPRAEQLPVSEARIQEARAQLLAHEAELRHAQGLYAQKLLGDNEFEQRRQAVEAARGQVALAEAEDHLLRAGTSQADRDVARAQCDEAQALVAQAHIELDRLSVKAPIDGTVLQVNVRVGEAVPGRLDLAPVVLGDLRDLHVRVELEEELLPRFRADAPAEASPRGQPSVHIPLKLVRIEPLVVPKRTPSGTIGERSDVRVLPVIYQLEAGSGELYVGQQMDVFIETKGPASSGE